MTTRLIYKPLLFASRLKAGFLMMQLDRYTLVLKPIRSWECPYQHFEMKACNVLILKRSCAFLCGRSTNLKQTVQPDSFRTVGAFSTYSCNCAKRPNCAERVRLDGVLNGRSRQYHNQITQSKGKTIRKIYHKEWIEGGGADWRSG